MESHSLMFSEGNVLSYEALTDEEALATSLIHPKAFEVIVQRYQAAFLRKAQAIIHDERDAQDIVADTFVKLYFNAEKFVPREGASFNSWAYRILINTALSRYRSRSARDKYEISFDPTRADELIQDQDGPPASGWERLSIAESVRTTLTRLPEHLSRILRYFYLEGRPQREIARMEGLSLAAVKTRIHRAKHEFRKVSTYEFPSFSS